MRINLYAYWGKTRQDSSDLSYHPLVHHCLDVAAVVAEILRRDPLAASRLRTLSPVGKAETFSLLVTFACLHDLGKFAPCFQYKVPVLAEKLGVPRRGAESRKHHTEIGYFIWRELGGDFARELGLPDSLPLDPLAGAAFGHHGSPVDQEEKCSRLFRPVQEDIRLFVDTVRQAFAGGGFPGFKPLHLPEDLDETAFRKLSWLAAGLFVLADWIGSNDVWFPHDAAPHGFEGYWRIAQGRAERAVAGTRILSSPASQARGFHDLLPNIPPAAEPHPMQQVVLDLPEPQGPELVIIEDLTGGGKTEASLLAAHRLMRAGLASGIYDGLPTMATANAMYGRLADSYRALFQDPSASLVLAHGSRILNKDYMDSVGLETGADPQRDEEIKAYCAAWFADNRKKALLAPCGAGTLDQALLAVLPSRHQSLRLWGLARSVLVADEIHAYDAYTGTLLESLLTFHAALGGSAVILSATITKKLRASLVSAWQKGRDLSGAAGVFQAEPERGEFPLLTRVTDSAIDELPVASTRAISFTVSPVNEEAAMFEALARANGDGACACWIRNTVEDAVNARRELVARYGVAEQDVELFHARFAGCDRREIEERVLAHFGKDSTPKERRGKILLASQVAEQSLDFDMDLMLTDLAPMDLIIQRAGRCHRHGGRIRPKGYENPVVMVLMPEPSENADAEWYARLFPKGQYVYREPGLLWRTARLLVEKGSVELPRDARELVESAYDGPAPGVFSEADGKAQGEEYGKKDLAYYSTLFFEHGYCRGGGTAWEEEVRACTRLGEETTQVRLVRIVDGRPELWSRPGTARPTIAACLESEVRVATRKITSTVIPLKITPALEAYKGTMADQGKWCLVLPLTSGDGILWRGRAVNNQGEEVEVTYGPEGLGFDSGQGID